MNKKIIETVGSDLVGRTIKAFQETHYPHGLLLVFEDGGCAFFEAEKDDYSLEVCLQDRINALDFHREDALRLGLLTTEDVKAIDKARADSAKAEQRRAAVREREEYNRLKQKFEK